MSGKAIRSGDPHLQLTVAAVFLLLWACWPTSSFPALLAAYVAALLVV